ncbi:hypothetical protein T12_1479 [Trichinella patagoniensis]|uniref:Uncharacterized protein n=1 Tax=Trichinella patagoniensis TaxID=990121 RepID=A0A0V0ZXV9_9BILA|nr:hypothetical protein T12_1479 [Trichinella patagoniensis]
MVENGGAITGNFWCDTKINASENKRLTQTAKIVALKDPSVTGDDSFHYLSIRISYVNNQNEKCYQILTYN